MKIAPAIPWSLALAIATALGLAAPAKDAAIYGCPMHPDTRSTVPGTCPRCGMALVQMGPPGQAPYPVALETEPRDVKAGETVRLRFIITHPATGERVSELNVVHDMPFHLFVVSDDLSYYDHIHPAADRDGAFTIDTMLPKAGEYNLYCDFVPVGGLPQVAHLHLATASYQPPLPRRAPHLTPDRELTKTVDGIRFELTTEPPSVAAGNAAAFVYHLVDEKTGAPVTDLEPYLGAWGHTLILSDDAERYVHSHPTQMVPAGADRATMSGGPDVSFDTTLARPGIHRLWSQFKRGGRVTTVSFTLDVAQVDHVAAWSGKSWTGFPGTTGSSVGPDGTVRALAARGKWLLAGGDFASAGGETVNGIAAWDGRRWSALGGGVDGIVRAIAVSGSDVYVGGEFTSAGGVAARAVARWDGRDWSPLGGGVAGSRDALRPAAVYTIVARGRDVYVGGRFLTASGAPAHGVARWDGERFTALDGGVVNGDYDGVVWAMAFFKDELYVGGQFLTAGDLAARNIARWDGRSWRPVGGGVTGGLERVAGLAASGGRLYVGGDFTMAGDVSVNQLAAWDGSRWQPLPLRTSDSVRAIAAGGDGVYVAGGSFTLAPGVKTTGIVKGDGKSWSPLAKGLASGGLLSPVLAIALAGGIVYVGGGPFIVR